MSSWPKRWAGQHLRQTLKQGELRVLAIALALSVAAASAVNIFSDRVWRAISSQSGDALGADILLSSRAPFAEDYLAQINEQALRQSRGINLPSVLWHQDFSSLAGIKVVDNAYPLRGQLKIADAPFADSRDVQSGPKPGEAWADIQLWSDLQLEKGAKVEIGAIELTVSALLVYEPDRGSGFVDMAPRLLINQADLAATELLVEGSRAQHRLALAGDQDKLAAVRALDHPVDVKIISPEDARPEIRSALSRADNFLSLAAMSASLLAAIAIALCAHQHGQRLQKEVALLRCLGAQRREIQQALLLSTFALWLIAGGLGAMLGLSAQGLLAGLADTLLVQDLPAANFWPALQSLGLGLLLLLGFALPPLNQASSTPPIKVFQSEVGNTASRWQWPLLAVLCLALSLHMQSRDPALPFAVLAGQFGTALALALMTLLLLSLARPLRQARLHGWLLGIGNLLRRPAQTTAQSIALGLGLLILLLLGVVRQDLLEGWQQRLPPETPNQFLINIQAEQLDELRSTLENAGLHAERIWPMIRSRLVKLNGQSVTVDDFTDEDTRRWINRDFNLSWTDTLGSDNTLIEGEWWGKNGLNQPWLSADDYAKERLNLKIGDSLSLNIAGKVYDLEVRNFREVDWESFQPNFFLITPPGILKDAPGSWLSSFYLPPEKRPMMRDFSRQFPNVTVIDLDAMMKQVRQIMDKIVSALEFVFLFTLGAGLLVLLAAMESGREERSREIALMRTLGVSTTSIRKAMLAEYAGLGLLSGTIAAIAAQACGWALAEFVFDFDYSLQPALFIYGSLGGAVLVAGLAWLNLRSVLRTPPRQILA